VSQYYTWVLERQDAAGLGTICCTTEGFGGVKELRSRSKVQTYPIQYQQRKSEHGKAISDLQSSKRTEADGKSRYKAEQCDYGQCPCCGLSLDQHLEHRHDWPYELTSNSVREILATG